MSQERKKVKSHTKGLGLVSFAGQSVAKFLRFDGADSQFDLVKWIIKLRWVTAALQFLSLIPAMYLGFVDQSNIMDYVLVMTLPVIVNSVLTIYGPTLKEKMSPETQIMWGLIFDMQQLFVLLAMTGGWNNPFRSMLFVFATLAAMSLGKGRSMAIGVLLVVDIVLLQKIFRSDIPTRIDWSNTFADMLVESVVGLSLMAIVSSLISRLISQAKQVSQLRKARLRMDRLRAIGALSSGVCHQLATPLNNIGMRLERLLRETDESDEDTVANIRSMKRSLNKADRALRKLADIQVDPAASGWEKVDFGDFIDGAIKSWLADPARETVQVRCNNFPKLMVSIPVSSVMQVVLDIMDNGAEAKDNGVTCLTVSIEVDGKYVSVSVEDEGPGFSQQALTYLGEPFNSEKTEGSGLGLYHAQLIAQLMGGSLSVNNLEKGAKVTFQFARSR